MSLCYFFCSHFSEKILNEQKFVMVFVVSINNRATASRTVKNVKKSIEGNQKTINGWKNMIFGSFYLFLPLVLHSIRDEYDQNENIDLSIISDWFGQPTFFIDWQNELMLRKENCEHRKKKKEDEQKILCGCFTIVCK